MRCYRNGRALPPNYFFRSVPGHARRGQTVPEIDSARLRIAAEQGGTIIVDQVDRLIPTLGDYVSVLECDLDEFVNVNAYASWGETFGFNRHWGVHDIFNLQVSGSKKWRLYGTTRENPLNVDLEFAPNPSDEPKWERVLKAGELLYLPRGVWHDAQNVNTGSLHLTLEMRRRTGVDYLEWLIQKATADPIFRADLPFLGPMESQDERDHQLTSRFVRLMNENRIDTYRRYLASQASERTTLYLDTSRSLLDAMRENGAFLSLSSRSAMLVNLREVHSVYRRVGKPGSFLKDYTRCSNCLSIIRH